MTSLEVLDRVIAVLDDAGTEKKTSLTPAT